MDLLSGTGRGWEQWFGEGGDGDGHGGYNDRQCIIADNVDDEHKAAGLGQGHVQGKRALPKSCLLVLIHVDDDGDGTAYPGPLLGLLLTCSGPLRGLRGMTLPICGLALLPPSAQLRS